MRGKALVLAALVLAACARGGVARPAARGGVGAEPVGQLAQEPAFPIEKPPCVGFDACRDRCEGKHDAACVWAGRYEQRDRNGSLFYTKACALRHEEGCVREAMAAQPLHLHAIERACGRGVAEACERLGWAYARGESVATDAAKSQAYYKRAAQRYVAACEAESGLDCSGAASLYDDGAGVTRDAGRADALYQRACQLGDAFGCERMAATAKTGADAACRDSAPGACNRVGLRYEVGREIAFDPVHAAASYKKACDAGDAHGCALLGYSYEVGIGVTRDVHKASLLYGDACDRGEMLGCYGEARFAREGIGDSRNLQAAATLFEKACEASKDGLGCRELTEMYESGQAKNTQGAPVADLYERSCDAGDSLACMHGATLLTEGKKIARDTKRALRLLDAACDQRYGPACFMAGKIYATGDLVDKDADAAVKWFQRGCDASDSESCAALKPTILAPRKPRTAPQRF